MSVSIKALRPVCSTDGCNKNVVAIKNYYDEDGNKIRVNWRKYCGTCHSSRTAAKHGLKTISDITARRNGFESGNEYRRHQLEQAAREEGFDNVIDYLNSKHPYRKYRKTYCENIDGRLGFTCTTNIFWLGMLDVDHIDGNSENNVEENFQTLCKCCHTYKGYVAKDYLSPGRKALKALKNNEQV